MYFKPNTSLQRSATKSAAWCELQYVPIGWVESIDYSDYDAHSAQVTLSEGREWLSIHAKLQLRSYNNEPEEGAGGPLRNLRISLSLTGNSLELIQQLTALPYRRYIVKLTLPGGQEQVLGNLEEAVRMNSNSISEGGAIINHNITLNWQHPYHPYWIPQIEPPVDEGVYASEYANEYE